MKDPVEVYRRGELQLVGVGGDYFIDGLRAQSFPVEFACGAGRPNIFVDRSTLSPT